MKFSVKRSSLQGTIQVPGNKSATARAIVLGGLAEGISKVGNPLPGVDSFSIVDMMRALGAKIDTTQPGQWIFEGVANQPKVPGCVLDAGNSGTGYYLIAAVSALVNGYSVVSGDYQICRRPARPLIDALNDLGARVFSTRNSGTAPLVIQGPHERRQDQVAGRKLPVAQPPADCRCPLPGGNHSHGGRPDGTSLCRHDHGMDQNSRREHHPQKLRGVLGSRQSALQGLHGQHSRRTGAAPAIP